MSLNSNPGAGDIVVVTGGAGFIGSHLADALLANGRKVVVVDNLATGKRHQVPDEAIFVNADISDADAMMGIVREHGPVTTWFHLAAQIDVRQSVADPLLDARSNVLGTINVLEAARADGAGVVFSSTGGAIYGNCTAPAPEDSPARPAAPYAASKIAAEKYIETSARLYGLPHVILRFGNVYGPRQDPHGEAGVVAIFGGAILDSHPIKIFGDGSQTRDYVFVGDVVETTIAAEGAGVRGGENDVDAEIPVFNVGTGVETSVLELWETMKKVTGGDPGYDLADARPGELSRSVLDVTRARTQLGVALDTPMDHGMLSTVEWLKESRG